MGIFVKLYNMLVALFRKLREYVLVEKAKSDLVKYGKDIIEAKTGLKFDSKENSYEENEKYEEEYDDTPMENEQVASTAITVGSRLDIDVEREKIIKEFDWSPFFEPEIKGNPNGSKLLMVDDIEFTENLYMTDFRKMGRTYNRDVNDDYALIGAFGINAGFIAYKYLMDGNTVDKAILDITLGHYNRNAKGDYLELDGIDIAIKLLEINPNADIRFVSAHTLNKHNPALIYYIKKFETIVKKPIDKFYINKNLNRFEELANFIYGHIPKDES